MKCPSCGAAVEDGADLCLECGEPMGDSPVARAVRSEAVPAEKLPSAAAPAKPATPAAPAKPATPAAPAKPATPAAPAKPAVRARRRNDESETVRCPGCGIPTQKDRCPGCGTRIHRSDD